MKERKEGGMDRGKGLHAQHFGQQMLAVRGMEVFAVFWIKDPPENLIHLFSDLSAHFGTT